MDAIKQLKKLCEKAGIELIERDNGHYQLNGQQLVNYYPLSKKQTAYIKGTSTGINYVSPEQAIELTKTCQQLPKVIERKRKGYKADKKKLFKHQQTCNWCGGVLTLETATLDHIYPLSKGGLDQPNNWTLACHACNQKRGNSMPELNQS